MLAALFRNTGLEPSFQGVAPISVLRLDGEDNGRYNSRLNTAVAQAKAAVAAELADEALSVTSDPEQGTIQFIATAASPDDGLAGSHRTASGLSQFPPRRYGPRSAGSCARRLGDGDRRGPSRSSRPRSSQNR